MEMVIKIEEAPWTRKFVRVGGTSNSAELQEYTISTGRRAHF